MLLGLPMFPLPCIENCSSCCWSAAVVCCCLRYISAARGESGLFGGKLLNSGVIGDDVGERVGEAPVELQDTILPNSELGMAFC